MSIVHLTRENFEETVAQGEIAVVDFYADWCGPCKMFAPVFEELSGELSDVVFGKLNVDNEEELAAKYGVMSIPTVIVFKNGEPASSSIGLIGKQKLSDMIALAKSE
ncbi:MAG: thioredoxin [Clostridia bacterium]|nr:thioredoxin [Clostridia bacterium]